MAINISTRKLLKNVGINSQRIIENSIRNSINDGIINDSKKIKVSVTLEISELNIKEIIDGDIEVELWRTKTCTMKKIIVFHFFEVN